jgi:hypothetical protein
MSNMSLESEEDGLLYDPSMSTPRHQASSGNAGQGEQAEPFFSASRFSASPAARPQQPSGSGRGLRGVNQSLSEAPYGSFSNSSNSSSEAHDDDDDDDESLLGVGFGRAGGGGEAAAARRALRAAVAARFGSAASAARVKRCLAGLGVEAEADLRHVDAEEVAAAAKQVGAWKARTHTHSFY